MNGMKLALDTINLEYSTDFFLPPLPSVYLTTMESAINNLWHSSCFTHLEHLKADREENHDSFIKPATQELRQSSQAIESHRYRQSND